MSKEKLKKLAMIYVLVILLVVFFGLKAHATPSTTYWTPCVIDIQGFGVGHITYDNYVTVAKKGDKKGGFPNDWGLTYGVLPFKKLQMEIGFDWMEPSEYPLFFNAKIGAPEEALFKNSPALEVGIFNVGTKKNVTDQNIIDFITGKTLPANLGRVHLGYYVGNSNTLLSSAGEKKNKGYMVGYDWGFFPVRDADGTFNKYVFAADYASGKNALGGGGLGIYVYFTRNIDLLAGPVWFNDKGINGGMKWTSQLDINF